MRDLETKVERELALQRRNDATNTVDCRWIEGHGAVNITRICRAWTRCHTVFPFATGGQMQESWPAEQFCPDWSSKVRKESAIPEAFRHHPALIPRLVWLRVEEIFMVVVRPHKRSESASVSCG